MAKRPSTSKNPAEDDELIIDECRRKLDDDESNDVGAYFEDDNQQGTSYRTPFMPSHLGLIQDQSPDLTMKDLFNRKRSRPQSTGFIDHSQARYYDRYKQQEYTRRNDFMKYCHVCRKKTVGKLRVLPGDLRMRKVWILRSNLDEERSAELWLREMACEGSHGGEFCEAHFPAGSQHMKGNQLIPLDVRPEEGRHSVVEDIQFDFDAIHLQCVFCGRDGPLATMLPFIRNRAKRLRWIEQLASGNETYKNRLLHALRGGVTQFLCDYHISDSSFEINGFGEWRLLKNALPDPRLVASDKRGERKYLVDKCRDEMFWERAMWKSADLLSQNGTADDEDIIVGDDIRQFLTNSVPSEAEQVLHPILQIKQNVEKKLNEADLQPGTSGTSGESNATADNLKIGISEEGVEYSDDSDEENELIEKMGDIPYSKRLCQVCSAVEPIGNEFPNNFPYKFSIRTWPFDECRHKKWLEIMDWPPEFEESMKTLWQKRKTEGALSDSYHFCPINVCQSHLDFRQLPERMEEWHQTFCLLCDTCMSDKSFLVGIPHNFETRTKWANSLFPVKEGNKFQLKKISWLRRRFLRSKPTRYRICVYHFNRKAFQVNQDDKIVLDAEALPLPIDSDDFDLTPRGPNSVCKCVLCDDWKKVEDMVPFRAPHSEAERSFLIDIVIHSDKMTIKKALASLAKTNRPALICNIHFPDGIDPFSIIAERRLMYGVQSECVLCAHANDCTAMIPFPGPDDEKLRTKWINSMCREPWIYRYLSTRLEKPGRHYLCASHFNRNSLRYHAGLGLWRRAAACPVLACTTDEERQEVWDLSKSQPLYHPLILETFDDNGSGRLDYDDVLNFLGTERMRQIETELNFHGRNDSLLRRENRKKNTGRSFYADMPNIYEHGELQEVEDQMEGEEEEVVQEECIIYEEEHHLDEAEELEVIEEEEVVEEIVEQVVDDGVVVGEEM
ncbi:High Incidence of Males (increased X chromosome loss) [Caenorhabditis elegans]|uniref:High Incidence of Males (Increased X chromosome loss) n=1 Tax=Caenorhabditis elegans TaxID=6239 RepID=Q22360_CAEEL|nr:High Incidence of Males (increased X chromosome loss) [Caenorhabditis elegans]CAB01515.1 High Incidence of Males (increased X chromosome loss) [Caenorhabditis elegans]|eukprot:NP_506277.1 High Incidence of Males (increased X chromosome loss) [Caenorhabditis elegans]